MRKGSQYLFIKSACFDHADALKSVEVEPNFGAFVDTDAVRVAKPDGGVIEAEEDVRESVDPQADENAPRSRDAEVLTDEDENEDERGTFAEPSDDLPCFECWMNAGGFEV